MLCVLTCIRAFTWYQNLSPFLIASDGLGTPIKLLPFYFCEQRSPSSFLPVLCFSYDVFPFVAFGTLLASSSLFVITVSIIMDIFDLTHHGCTNLQCHSSQLYQFSASLSSPFTCRQSPHPYYWLLPLSRQPDCWSSASAAWFSFTVVATVRTCRCRHRCSYSCRCLPCYRLPSDL